jgi:hypothetical protein
MRFGKGIFALFIAFQVITFFPEMCRCKQNTVFTDETEERLPQILDASHDADFADIDLDGDLDILVSNNYLGTYRYNLVLLNDGTGYFHEDSTRMFPRIYHNEPYEMTPGDIEGDGDLDVIVAMSESFNKLFVNTGAGYFIEESHSRLPRGITPRSSWDIDFADVDGDLTLDHVEVNWYDSRNLLLLNDGLGFFTITRAWQFPSGKDSSTRGFVADVDGDYDVDVYIVNYGDPNKLMINDGNGFFSDASDIRIPVDDYQSYGGVFGDVDLDGDFDVIIANTYPPTNQILINRGDGCFEDRTDELIPWDRHTSFQISLGDVDNDGDLDILSAVYDDSGDWDRMLINDGFGRFADESNSYLPTGESNTLVLVLGDVDGDGDLDIFECNHGPTLNDFARQNHLFINNGTPDAHPPVITRTFQHPDTKETMSPYLITSTVWDNISVVTGELRVYLLYRSYEDGSMGMVEEKFFGKRMLDCGAYLFRQEIPARDDGWRIDYYIKAVDKMGNVSFDPPAAPNSVYSFLVDASEGSYSNEK